MTDDVQIIEAKNFYELPTYYMMFPDDVPAAIKRAGELSMKLFERDKRVANPIRIFRIMQMGKPFLAIELEHIEQEEKLAQRTTRKHAKKGKYHNTAEAANEVD